MSVSPYWNPKTETMPREELRALQGYRLKSLVKRAYHTSVFHKRLLDEAGVKPDDIRGYDDLARLPFTTRDAWMENQAEHQPFGEMVAIDPDLAIRYHTTSGTTGRTPLRVLDTRADWKWIATSHQY